MEAVINQIPYREPVQQKEKQEPDANRARRRRIFWSAIIFAGAITFGVHYGFKWIGGDAWKTYYYAAASLDTCDMHNDLFWEGVE